MAERQPEGHPTPGPWWRRALAALGFRPACAAQLTPEEDMAIAYRAFSDGELPHAAFHVACALYDADPTDKRMLGLLDRLIKASQERGADPLSLAPLKRNNYAGTVAVRAYVLAQLGRYGEATELLAQVVNADRDRLLWKWAVDWVQRPGVAAQIDPGVGASLLAASSISRHPGIRVEDPAAVAELESVVPAAEALVKAHPRQEMLPWLYGSVLRKIGRLDDAARVAAQAWAASPSYMNAIGLAMARSAQGDVDGAVAGYAEALKLDPKDSAAPADAALALYGAGRHEEALRWAEEARQRDPQKKTAALPLSFLLRYRLGQGQKWMDALFQFANEHPDHGWARDVVSRLRFYVDYLPNPEEATINAVCQMLAQHGEVEEGMSDVRFSVSSMEVPSTRRAVEMALKLRPGTLKVDVAAVPSPDPREPVGPVDYLLWKYDGTEPRPAVDPPPAEVVGVVGDLARRPYDLEDWSKRAGDIAARLGASSVQGLLGVMAHPPPAPEQWKAWDWIRAVQFAATIILSKIDSGWEGSTRRKALVSIARGPVDWTTEAAVIVLSQVAREETLPDDAREEIVAVLRDLAQALPDQGHCCYHYALAVAVSRLPFPAERMRPKFSKLWRYLESIDSADEAENGR